MKKYNTIDLLKLFFSLTIVGIHTDLLAGLSDKTQWYIMHLVFRVAVPFFFCASGFFLGKKVWMTDGSGRDAVFKKYRSKLYAPLFVWGGIGLLIFAVKIFLGGKYTIFGVALRTLRYGIFYPLGAMWYVAACIVASFIIQFFLKKKCGIKIIWLIGILGYAFALISNTYYFLVEDTFIGSIVLLYMKICVSARNGLFLCILLWLGVYLAKPEVYNKMSEYKKQMIGVLCISAITFLLEVMFTYGKNVMDDSALFVSFIVFIPVTVFLALEHNLTWGISFSTCRELSTTIYFSHSFVRTMVELFVVNEVICFFIVVLIAVLLYMLKVKWNNKWLNAIL